MTRIDTLGALAVLKIKEVTTSWDYGLNLGYHLVRNDHKLTVLRVILKAWREN